MTEVTPPIEPYSAFRAEVWSGKINTGLDKTCVMLQCVNRDYQADADKGAEKINIVTPADVVTGSYTGTIASYGASDAQKQQLELDQFVYFGFAIPDIAQAQTNIGIMDAITAKAKKAVEASIDSYLFGQYVNADANNQLGSTAVPIGLTKTNVYENFVKLAKCLKNTGAVTGAKKGWVVVHPEVEELLLLSGEFTSSANLGDNTLKEGTIGKIAGLDVYVSNNVGKNSDHYAILAGTTDAITYASQIKKIETIRSMHSFESVVRGLYTFGALTLNPKALASAIVTIA